MSTIVFRDGVLACDSRAYYGRASASPGSKIKIWRLKNGDRLGVCSSMVGAGEAIRDWFDGAWVHKKDYLPSEYDLMLVKRRQELFVAKSSVYLSGPIQTDFYAIGSGCDFALGAMALGADARRAIEVASRFDPFTGGDVHILDYAP